MKQDRARGERRANITTLTSAPAPSQQALFSAQEMTLCRQKGRRYGGALNSCTQHGPAQGGGTGGR